MWVTAATMIAIVLYVVVGTVLVIFLFFWPLAVLLIGLYLTNRYRRQLTHMLLRR